MGIKIKPLISMEEIKQRTKELAKDILDETGNKLYTITVLEGAVPFSNDLISALKDYGVEIVNESIKLSSYKGTKSLGKIVMENDLDMDVKGKDILIIEDILDTGTSLNFLKQHLIQKGAKNIKIVALLNKKERRKFNIDADFSGFDIPDKFVVGYGMDYNQKYRSLNYIGEIYED